MDKLGQFIHKVSQLCATKKRLIPESFGIKRLFVISYSSSQNPKHCGTYLLRCGLLPIPAVL